MVFSYGLYEGFMGFELEKTRFFFLEWFIKYISISRLVCFFVESSD